MYVRFHQDTIKPIKSYQSYKTLKERDEMKNKYRPMPKDKSSDRISTNFDKNFVNLTSETFSHILDSLSKLENEIDSIQEVLFEGKTGLVQWVINLHKSLSELNDKVDLIDNRTFSSFGNLSQTVENLENSFDHRLVDCFTGLADRIEHLESSAKSVDISEALEGPLSSLVETISFMDSGIRQYVSSLLNRIVKVEEWIGTQKLNKEAPDDPLGIVGGKTKDVREETRSSCSLKSHADGSHIQLDPIASLYSRIDGLALQLAQKDEMLFRLGTAVDRLMYERDSYSIGAPIVPRHM